MRLPDRSWLEHSLVCKKKNSSIKKRSFILEDMRVMTNRLLRELNGEKIKCTHLSQRTATVMMTTAFAVVLFVIIFFMLQTDGYVRLLK